MKHLTGAGHPEKPERVESIEMALKEANLMDRGNTLEPRAATPKEISLCHEEAYQVELGRQIEDLELNGMEYSSFNNKDWKENYVPGDFNICPETLNVSLFAAGAPLTAIEYILDKNNKTSRAFCIVRPPGHHAHQHTGSGFCVFNNVAIAAKHLTQNLGFQRVLIVDWDAHHGDGTQDLKKRDKNERDKNDQIFYFSTHKDTVDGFYPGPHWGKAEEQGGMVLNCPVSGTKEACREGILKAFKEQLVPAMDEYKPDFVLISCGFDAHENDTLVGLGLKDEDFEAMKRFVLALQKSMLKGALFQSLKEATI